MAEKRRVTHYFGTIELGSVDKAIEDLQRFQKEAAEKDITNLEISITGDSEYGYDTEVYGDRLETDEEAVKREAQEKAYKDRQEEFDYQRYLQLRQRFANRAE